MASRPGTGNQLGACLDRGFRQGPSIGHDGWVGSEAD